MMEINYSIIKLYKNNLFIPIKESRTKPVIILNVNPIKIYTLLMFDPEAIGGNKIHWLMVNINHNDILTGNVLIKYKGPYPPKGTGLHHYTFVLFEQIKFINIANLKFNSRFVELDILFKKLGFNKNNLELKNIKYFVSENK